MRFISSVLSHLLELSWKFPVGNLRAVRLQTMPKGDSNMTRTISLIAALLIAGPAFAQTPPADPAQKSPTNQNIQPGTGGVSKAGKDGVPDNKSGPALKAPDASGSSTTAPAANEGASTGTGGSDDSGVPGAPGGTAGPAK
jgi:hypothetical protein